jgi:putative inorganic carbon (HCO3(-)) transporter
VLRRLLLGLVTALIIARPLVLGEDPGLLAPQSGTSNLVLSLLWLVALAGWAAWRAWSQQRDRRGGVLELGLLAVAACAFVSAAVAAAYKHPAWLIAWEWVVLLAVFVLVRQLARTPAENHGLLAAVLASAVSIAAYAVYQYTVELPALRSTLADPNQLREAMAREHIFLDADDSYLQNFRRRVEQDNAFGTFAHPNTFAGYLALLLPALAGRAVVAARVWGRSWRTVVAMGCAVLVGVALWLTHSRGAILATLLVGAVVGLLHGRRFLWAHKGWVAGGLVVLLGVAALALRDERLAAGLGKATRSGALRQDYWTATWAMINDHPWLGVGPGNFGRSYPRYMVPTAFERIQDPHNFALELWATCGLFGLLALLVTLAAFFRAARPHLTAAPDPEPWTLNPRPTWLFYYAGMAGLFLAFLLRVLGMNADEILLEGVSSGVRAVIWFAAFALFDGLLWIGPSLVLALVMGFAAALLNLLVSGGITAPSLAQVSWVVAALALNGREPQPEPHTGGGDWLRRVLPAPLLAAVCLTYFR